MTLLQNTHFVMTSSIPNSDSGLTLWRGRWFVSGRGLTFSHHVETFSESGGEKLLGPLL